MNNAILRLKRAFEDKDVEAMEKLFTPDPHIHVDGRFYSIQPFLKSMYEYFREVDQTYLDVVGTRRIEEEDEMLFAVYDIDVAWIDKREWLERVQKVVLALELVREPRSSELLIAGLSATTLQGKDRGGGQEPGAPADGGGAADGRDSGGSIWY
jgi:hypothetical protein